MVKVDTIEGTVDDVLWYHYDLANDVLYLRLAAHRDAPTYAEESAEGFLVVRPAADDGRDGITVVNGGRALGRP